MKLFGICQGKNGLTILTADRDFFDLAARFGPPPKVIRLENMNYRTKVAGEVIQQNALRIAEFDIALNRQSSCYALNTGECFGMSFSRFLNECGEQAQRICGGALGGVCVYGVVRAVSGERAGQRPRL